MWHIKGFHFMVTKNPVSPMQGIELWICLEASQLWQLLHLYHSYRQVLGFFPAGSSITKRNVHINLETNLELSKQLKLLVISLLFIAFSVCILSCFFLQVTSISFSRGSHRACSGCSPRHRWARSAPRRHRPRGSGSLAALFAINTQNWT